jgi:Tfp pilus assembly protein PilO
MDRAFRRNTIILAGSLVAIIALYAVVYWLPNRRFKAETLRAIQSTRDGIETCKKQGTQLTALNVELGQLQAYNQMMSERIPVALNVKDFLATVHSLGQREGVTIAAVTPGIAADLVGIQQQQISVTLVGEFHAIARLMYELEAMTRMVDLSDLDIRTIDKAGMEDQLEAKLNVRLFARPAKPPLPSQNSG